MLKSRCVTPVVLSMLLCVGAAQAETDKPHLKRETLQQIDVPGTAYTTIMSIAEVPPGLKSASHTHPGVEVTYVLDGVLTLIVDGAPDRVVKTGDSLKIPAGTIHTISNASDKPAKLLVTWVLEKDKPMSSPVAMPPSTK